MSATNPRRAETEQQRCRRQRKQAAARVAVGKMAREDFDWYERTYWGLHDPITKTNPQTATGGRA